MAFDVSLLPWQEEVWDDPARFKVVAAGRRTGKSRLAAYMLLVKGLQTTDGEIFYVAPTQGQARDILWNLLLELGQGVIASSHINNMQIKLVNGTQISLKGSDRPETLRGAKISFVAIDEYADMKADVWEQILRPALTDLAPKSSALFIGTPTGRNHFWELYKKAHDLPQFLAQVTSASLCAKVCVRTWCRSLPMEMNAKSFLRNSSTRSVPKRKRPSTRLFSLACLIRPFPK